jgi:hypothetical protein
MVRDTAGPASSGIDIVWDNCPPEYRSLRIWVIWRAVHQPDGKIRKTPWRPGGQGPLKWKSPLDRLSFEDVQALYLAGLDLPERNGKHFSGVGFVVPEMVEVLTRIGRVLDSHSEPSLAVPEDAITKNPQTGESSFDTSLKIFPIGEGQRLPQYIEWEGQMEASFKELEFLMNQFYTVSETCPQAFGQSISGTAESGTSLRLRIMLRTSPGR